MKMNKGKSDHPWSVFLPNSFRTDARNAERIGI